MTTEDDKPAKTAPPKRRKRRKRKKPDEPVHYVIRLTDWDCHYSFRISDPRSEFDIGPYSDLATLTLSGDLIEPENSKYDKAELTLSARDDMGEEKWREPPSAIGSLGAYEDTLTGYVFVPSERMAMLVSLAGSGKVQRVWMLGTRLRYRSGRVLNISIDTSPEEVKWSRISGQVGSRFEVYPVQVSGCLRLQSAAPISLIYLHLITDSDRSVRESPKSRPRHPRSAR